MYKRCIKYLFSVSILFGLLVPSTLVNAQDAVVGFVLIDADTDRAINSLVDGDVLVLDTLPTANLSVRADTLPATVGSVRFNLDSITNFRTENVAPYALFGDRSGNYAPWSGVALVGTHSLTATPFSGSKGSGTVGTPLSISFEIVEMSVGDPPGDIILNGLAMTADIVVSHFDGNVNDLDDIAALSIAALYAYSASITNKSYIFYNNNLAENDVNSQVAAMRLSAAFAAGLGITTHDYQSNTSAATNALVALFNSGQQVLSIEGGPMEAVYRALDRTSANNRSNITLISHSTWNENRNRITRSGVTQARTWADLKQDFPEVTYIDIIDQNPGFFSNGWNWLDSTTHPVLQDAREVMRNAGAKTNDASDSGMGYYSLTRKQNGTPEDAQQLFVEHLPDGPAPAPDPIPDPEPDPIPDPDPTPDLDLEALTLRVDVLEIALDALVEHLRATP